MSLIRATSPTTIFFSDRESLFAVLISACSVSIFSFADKLVHRFCDTTPVSCGGAQGISTEEITPSRRLFRWAIHFSHEGSFAGYSPQEMLRKE